MHKVYEKDKCAYMFQVNKNKMIIDIQSHGAPKLNLSVRFLSRISTAMLLRMR